MASLAARIQHQITIHQLNLCLTVVCEHDLQEEIATFFSDQALQVTPRPSDSLLLLPRFAAQYAYDGP